jgi:hypothetical protein
VSARVRAGLFLLTACACASAVYQLAAAVFLFDPQTRHVGVVDYYDRERFTGLAGSLPPGGVVGYVGDGSEDDELGSKGRYHLTQYVLAPCVLPEGRDWPLVLVNARPDRPPPPTVPGGQLLRDPGEGVRLFGREGR